MSVSTNIAGRTVKLLSGKMSTDQKNLLSVFSGLVALVIIFGIVSSSFFTSYNLLTVALQTSAIALIAVGQTYVMITTGIDLSIGSNIAFSAVVAGLCMKEGLPMGVSMLAALATGSAVGLFNGVMTVYGDIPPFIVTLGTMTAVRGLVLYITGGIPISGLPKSFEALGNGQIGIFPIPVVIMVVLVIIFGFVLAKTKLGRHTYAVGSNLEAARLSGIAVKKTLILAYVISGFLAAVAGLIVAARVVSATPTAGSSYELDAVAASVIGGTSTLGGEGMIAGSLVGAFIIGVLRNGLNLANISPFIQQIVIGLVIIGAVFFDRIKRRKG